MPETSKMTIVETKDQAQFLQWFPELDMLFRHFNIQKMDIVTKAEIDGKTVEKTFTFGENEKTVAQKLQEAIEEIDRVQNLYMNAGAGDTEPDGVWQAYLADAYNGVHLIVRKDPDTWQLYSDHEKASEAARALGEATEKATNLILDCPARDLQDVKRVLDNHIWRVCL